jgi:hypothetical protein
MALTTFTAAQVLTAAQLNAVQANDYNQTVSTKTASYTLVAADKGTRVVMNVASANTVTVNTSLFAAGDTLVIQNIGAGVTTVTAGTATVSSAGPLAIPQNGSGTLYFTSAGVSIFYPSAGPAASSGLTFITGATVTSGAQIAITNIFSATYTSYLFILNQLDQSVDNETMNVRLGSSGSADTGSNYSEARNSATASGTGGGGANNTDKWIIFQNGGTTNNYFNMTITNPQIAGNTWAVSNAVANRTTITGFTTRHILKTVTQYTDLFLFPDTGTVGTIKYQLFGYANS